MKKFVSILLFFLLLILFVLASIYLVRLLRNRPQWGESVGKIFQKSSSRKEEDEAGFIFLPEFSLGDSLAITKDTKIVDKTYTDFLYGIYNLNVITQNNLYLEKTYDIKTVEEFVKYAKSGKPIKNLVIPVGNGKGTEISLQAELFTKLKKVNEKIKLNKVSIRVFNKNQIGSFYNDEKLHSGAIYFSLPVSAFIELYKADNNDRYLQITLMSLNEAENNYPNKRYTIDAVGDEDGDPISNPQENNLMAANQGIKTLNWMLGVVKNFVQQPDSFLVGLWIENAGSDKDQLIITRADMAVKDPFFISSK